jgi:hypothetical protein
MHGENKVETSEDGLIQSMLLALAVVVFKRFLKITSLIFLLHSAPKNVVILNARSFLCPYVILHWKIYKWSKTRNDVTCCGLECKAGFGIWLAACFEFDSPAEVRFLPCWKTAKSRSCTKYALRCLVSEMHVTVKWLELSNDKIMAAPYLQCVFEVAFVNFSFLVPNIYL